jgi:hypothetical protein
MPKLQIKWRCPHCKHKHTWRWSKGEYDAAAADVIGTWMVCDYCGRESRMSPDSPTRWLWDGDWRPAQHEVAE